MLKKCRPIIINIKTSVSVSHQFECTFIIFTLNDKDTRTKYHLGWLSQKCETLCKKKNTYYKFPSFLERWQASQVNFLKHLYMFPLRPLKKVEKSVMRIIYYQDCIYTTMPKKPTMFTFAGGKDHYIGYLYTHVSVLICSSVSTLGFLNVWTLE